MARKKLTLSVDEDVIRRAKKFSEQHETSLSKLVTEFLSRLVDRQGEQAPLVSRLRGILPRATDVADYHQHLERKYRR